jgi:hypothetical protein
MAKNAKAAKPATTKTPPKQTAKPTGKAAKPAAPDWERIELDYRAGVKTLRQIAAEHGITHGAINKRAKRDGWERDLCFSLWWMRSWTLVLRHFLGPSSQIQSGG